MEIKEINDFASADKDSWNGLVEKTGGSIFQTFDWNDLWWKHFGEGSVRILQVFEDESLIGVAPFSELGGVVYLIGGMDITDYEDVIVLTEYRDKFWDSVFDYLKEYKKFDFHFVPPSGTCEAVQKVSGKYGLDFHFHTEEVAPYITLPDSFESYISALPRHDRQELRRKMRKFEEAGEWMIEKAKDGHDIDDFLLLHKSSDTAKEKFMSPKMEGFFREMAIYFFDRNRLDLSYLKLNGKRVASTLSFREKDRILAYNAGFDLSFGYLSVGLLAHAYAIKAAIDSILSVYDFLQGNERYKYQLGAVDKQLCHVTTIGDI